MKQILISGGAGFIGSHLAEELLRRGNTVICLDDLSTGSLSNLDSLIESPRFQFIKHDVREPYEIDCDEIYNLASPASPVHYSKHPIKTLMTNAIGAYNALVNADRNRATILQASTSEVYGNPQITPQSESYKGHVNCIGPRACYDEGKRCAETLFFDFHRTKEIDIRIARIFNTYGPKMKNNDGRVVSNFVLNALNNQPLAVNGDGRQTRSFCYVEDTVAGLITLMENPNCGPSPINLGNPEEIEVGVLARKIIDFCDSKSTVIYKELPQDDPRRRCPDISLAKSLLKWTPEISLNEGLQKTIDYFNSMTNPVFQGSLTK